MHAKRKIGLLDDKTRNNSHFHQLRFENQIKTTDTSKSKALVCDYEKQNVNVVKNLQTIKKNHKLVRKQKSGSLIRVQRNLSMSQKLSHQEKLKNSIEITRQNHMRSHKGSNKRSF